MTTDEARLLREINIALSLLDMKICMADVEGARGYYQSVTRLKEKLSAVRGGRALCIACDSFAMDNSSVCAFHWWMQAYHYQDQQIRKEIKMLEQRLWFKPGPLPFIKVGYPHFLT